MKALVKVKFDKDRDAFIKNIFTGEASWVTDNRLGFNYEESEDGYFLVTDVEIKDAIVYSYNPKIKSYQRRDREGFAMGNPAIGLCRSETIRVLGKELLYGEYGIRPFWARRLGTWELYWIMFKRAFRTTKD